MSIRANNNKKNHLRNANSSIAILSDEISNHQVDHNPLRFYTTHPQKPCLVDLTAFRDGRQQARVEGTYSWGGPFQGRPQLIEEIAPAIRDFFLMSPEKTIEQLLCALRNWWRIFDAVEAAAPEFGGVRNFV